MRLPFRIDNSDGHAIRGEVRTPRRGIDRGTIVFCHGFKGFWDWGGFPYFLDAATAAGFYAVAFSFSGSGVSEGDRVDEPERFAENTYTRQVRDLEEVVRALRGGVLPPFGRKPGRIGIVGHSMGGGVAILYAANDPQIGALVTWASIATVERYPDEVVRDWRARGWTLVTNGRTGQELKMSTAILDDIDANRERLDIVGAARRLAMPVLIVHGRADESVPVAEAATLAAAASGRAEQLLLDGEGHTFGSTHPFRGPSNGFDVVVSATIRWFGAHLSV
ncbi:MAG: alpha/beta hydrolase family protein [bacterium]